jgi:hypothetical protein
VPALLAGGLPMTIPWWMAVAIVGSWLAVIGGIVAIAYGRRRLARARRPTLLSPPPFDHARDRGLPERTDPVRELGPG